MEQLAKVSGAIRSQTAPADTSFLWFRIIDPGQPLVVEPRYFNGTTWVPMAGSGPITLDITVAGVGSVGGYSDGDVITAGTTLQEFAEKLLTQRIAATYTNPSLSLSIAGGQLFEVGDQQNVQVNVNFNQNDGGASTEFRLSKDGAVIETDNTAPIPNANYTDLVNIVNGNIPFVGSLDHLAGPIKNDNFGDPSPTGQIGAGTIGSNTQNIQGVYPYFYGSTGDGDANNVNIYGGTKVIANIGSSIVVPFAAATNFHWFAVPTNFNNPGTYTSWEENALNQGAIGGASNLFASKITRSVTSTGLNTNWTIDYDIYITNFQTAGVTLTLSK